MRARSTLWMLSRVMTSTGRPRIREVCSCVARQQGFPQLYRCRRFMRHDGDRYRAVNDNRVHGGGGCGPGGARRARGNVRSQHAGERVSLERVAELEIDVEHGVGLVASVPSVGSVSYCRPTPEQNPHVAHDPSAQTRGPAPGGRADAVPGLRREPCPACHRPCSRAVFHHGAADGNRSISARDEAPWPSSFT
jgi:hypothetical protein